ncbi:MAG: PAS domain S-box protein [Candidatus Schekmanbacteria bacterium]|nr:PAS domain S-box protein [Candidatus Schekmanbacteria bacterium]
MNEFTFILFLAFQVFLGTYVYISNPEAKENKLFSFWVVSNIIVSIIRLYWQTIPFQNTNSILVPIYISILMISNSLISFLVFVSLFCKRYVHNNRYIYPLAISSGLISALIFLDYFNGWGLISNGITKDDFSYPIMNGKMFFIVPVVMCLAYAMILLVGIKAVCEKDRKDRGKIAIVLMGIFTVFIANTLSSFPYKLTTRWVAHLCELLLIIIFSYYLEKNELFSFTQFALDKTFNSLDDLFIITDKDGKIVKINQSALALFNNGYSNMHSLNISDFFSAIKNTHNEKIIHEIECCLKNQKCDSCSYELQTGNKHYYLSASRIKDDKKFYGFNIFGKDITPIIESEKQTEKSKNYLENIIEASVDCIMITDSKGIIAKCNETAQKLSGYSKDEILGMRPMDFIPADEKYYIEGAQIIEKLLNNKEPAIWESAIQTKNGDIIPVEWSLNYFYDENGIIMGSIGICRDLRERKMLESQLMQNSKLAALGQLSAGIAHEINNPLAGILGYSQYLHKKISENTESGLTKEELEKIAERMKGLEKESQKCKQIIENLLKFSRPADKGDKGVLYLNDVINETLEVIEHNLFIKRITVEKHYTNDIKKIYGNNFELQQVFTNLFMNALQAMPDGGTITVSTGNVPHTNQNEEMVYACINDTGEGIDKEHLQKIFDPFFTTKRPGNGTGLGLSVSYGIIKKHEGNIDVVSVKGTGTVFTVTFPASEKNEFNTLIHSGSSDLHVVNQRF